mgnify:CR=1 FL=1|jgi:hypothetical protein
MSVRNFMYLNKTDRDAEYVEAYKIHGTSAKAADSCGVSRETIARAVRRAGIKLNGRRLNGKGNKGKGNIYRQKISDENLIKECKELNSLEIAKKYGMSPERVYRRARRLGIKINDKWTGGHYLRRMRCYGDAEYDDAVTLRAVMKRDHGICMLCGLPVDETDMKNGHPSKMYPTIDHIIPISAGGSHTWKNVQLAHNSCNARKCASILTVKEAEE